MGTVQFHIENWSAWAPGMPGKDEWLAWRDGKQQLVDSEEKPALDFLPAMFRRRLSQLSKAMIQVSFDCLQGQKNVCSVFASRHGEMQQLVKLLTTIHDHEIVSPASFSMSVHNTAAGLFSIADNNTASSNTVAGGEHTLEAAFIEAAGILQADPSKKVLLVIADEAVEEIFRVLLPDPMPPFAIAFLLTSDASTPGFSMKLSPSRSAKKYETSGHYGREFMRWFLGENNETLVLPGHRFDTVCERIST